MYLWLHLSKLAVIMLDCFYYHQGVWPPKKHVVINTEIIVVIDRNSTNRRSNCSYKLLKKRSFLLSMSLIQSLPKLAPSLVYNRLAKSEHSLAPLSGSREASLHNLHSTEPISGHNYGQSSLQGATIKPFLSYLNIVSLKGHIY